MLNIKWFFLLFIISSFVGMVEFVVKILLIIVEVGNFVELGKVNWERRLEKGIKMVEF